MLSEGGDGEEAGLAEVGGSNWSNPFAEHLKRLISLLLEASNDVHSSLHLFDVIALQVPVELPFRVPFFLFQTAFQLMLCQPHFFPSH